MNAYQRRAPQPGRTTCVIPTRNERPARRPWARVNDPIPPPPPGLTDELALRTALQSAIRQPQ